MNACIFCKIVRGEAPAHRIWEDERHLAFLSIFPNTEGFSVVIPKQHYPSYAFKLSDTVLSDLVIAAKSVGQLLDEKLSGVGRTGMIFEGFGMDHVHLDEPERFARDVAAFSMRPRNVWSAESAFSGAGARGGSCEEVGSRDGQRMQRGVTTQARRSRTGAPPVSPPARAPAPPAPAARSAPRRTATASRGEWG